MQTNAMSIVVFVAAFASVAAAQDSPPPFAAPGRLVDVGGWRLHLQCTGTAANAPIVVLEAGAGDFSVEWSLVQPRVSTFAHVCSYDRAGDGWSDLGPNPRTLHQVAYELHTLLKNASEAAPYVLVGHSYGGWLVRTYRSMYPTEVAGLVLVEGGFDNPWRLTPQGKLVRSVELASDRPVPAVKTAGPLKIGDIPPTAITQMRAGMDEQVRRANEAPRDRLPPDARRMRTWALGQLGHVASGFNPFLEEELAQLRAEHATDDRPYGSLPVVVITRGKSDDSDGPDGRSLYADRRRDDAAMAALSRTGTHVIASGSGHHVQLEESETVVTAIRHVLDASTSRKND